MKVNNENKKLDLKLRGHTFKNEDFLCQVAFRGSQMRVRHLYGYLVDHDLVHVASSSLLHGKKIGIDALHWYQMLLQRVPRNYLICSDITSVMTRMIIDELEYMKSIEMSPIFVFSGMEPGIHSMFSSHHFSQIEEGWTSFFSGDVISGCNLLSNARRLDTDEPNFLFPLLASLPNLCEAFRGSYLCAPQLVFFFRVGLVDAILGPSSCIVFGIPLVFTFFSKEEIRYVVLRNVLKHFSVSHIGLIHACILAGTTFSLTYPYLNLPSFRPNGKFSFSTCISLIKSSSLEFYLNQIPEGHSRPLVLKGFETAKALLSAPLVIGLDNKLGVMRNQFDCDYDLLTFYPNLNPNMPNYNSQIMLNLHTNRDNPTAMMKNVLLHDQISSRRQTNSIRTPNMSSSLSSFPAATTATTNNTFNVNNSKASVGNDELLFYLLCPHPADVHLLRVHPPPAPCCVSLSSPVSIHAYLSRIPVSSRANSVLLPRPIVPPGTSRLLGSRPPPELTVLLSKSIIGPQLSTLHCWGAVPRSSTLWPNRLVGRRDLQTVSTACCMLLLAEISHAYFYLSELSEQQPIRACDAALFSIRMIIESRHKQFSPPTDNLNDMKRNDQYWLHDFRGVPTALLDCLQDQSFPFTQFSNMNLKDTNEKHNIICNRDDFIRLLARPCFYCSFYEITDKMDNIQQNEQKYSFSINFLHAFLPLTIDALLLPTLSSFIHPEILSFSPPSNLRACSCMSPHVHALLAAISSSETTFSPSFLIALLFRDPSTLPSPSAATELIAHHLSLRAPIRELIQMNNKPESIPLPDVAAASPISAQNMSGFYRNLSQIEQLINGVRSWKYIRFLAWRARDIVKNAVRIRTGGRLGRRKMAEGEEWEEKNQEEDQFTVVSFAAVVRFTNTNHHVMNSNNHIAVTSPNSFIHCNANNNNNNNNINNINMQGREVSEIEMISKENEEAKTNIKMTDYNKNAASRSNTSFINSHCKQGNLGEDGPLILTTRPSALLLVLRQVSLMDAAVSNNPSRLSLPALLVALLEGEKVAQELSPIFHQMHKADEEEDNEGSDSNLTEEQCTQKDVQSDAFSLAVGVDEVLNEDGDDQRSPSVILNLKQDQKLNSTDSINNQPQEENENNIRHQANYSNRQSSIMTLNYQEKNEQDGNKFTHEVVDSQTKRRRDKNFDINSQNKNLHHRDSNIKNKNAVNTDDGNNNNNVSPTSPVSVLYYHHNNLRIDEDPVSLLTRERDTKKSILYFREPSFSNRSRLSDDDEDVTKSKDFDELDYEDSEESDCEIKEDDFTPNLLRCILSPFDVKAHNNDLCKYYSTANNFAKNSRNHKQYTKENKMKNPLITRLTSRLVIASPTGTSPPIIPQFQPETCKIMQRPLRWSHAIMRALLDVMYNIGLVSETGHLTSLGRIIANEGHSIRVGGADGIIQLVILCRMGLFKKAPFPIRQFSHQNNQNLKGVSGSNNRNEDKGNENMSTSTSRDILSKLWVLVAPSSETSTPFLHPNAILHSILISCLFPSAQIDENAVDCVSSSLNRLIEACVYRRLCGECGESEEDFERLMIDKPFAVFGLLNSTPSKLDEEKEDEMNDSRFNFKFYSSFLQKSDNTNIHYERATTTTTNIQTPANEDEKLFENPNFENGGGLYKDTSNCHTKCTFDEGLSEDTPLNKLYNDTGLTPHPNLSQERTIQIQIENENEHNNEINISGVTSPNKIPEFSSTDSSSSAVDFESVHTLSTPTNNCTTTHVQPPLLCGRLTPQLPPSSFPSLLSITGTSNIETPHHVLETSKIEKDFQAFYSDISAAYEHPSKMNNYNFKNSVFFKNNIPDADADPLSNNITINDNKNHPAQPHECSRDELLSGLASNCNESDKSDFKGEEEDQNCASIVTDQILLNNSQYNQNMSILKKKSNNNTGGNSDYGITYTSPLLSENIPLNNNNNSQNNNMNYKDGSSEGNDSSEQLAGSIMGGADASALAMFWHGAAALFSSMQQQQQQNLNMKCNMSDINDYDIHKKGHFHNNQSHISPEVNGCSTNTTTEQISLMNNAQSTDGTFNTVYTNLNIPSLNSTNVTLNLKSFRIDPICAPAFSLSSTSPWSLGLLVASLIFSHEVPVETITELTTVLETSISSLKQTDVKSALQCMHLYQILMRFLSIISRRKNSDFEEDVAMEERMLFEDFLVLLYPSLSSSTANNKNEASPSTSISIVQLEVSRRVSFVLGAVRILRHIIQRETAVSSKSPPFSYEMEDELTGVGVVLSSICHLHFKQ